MTDLGPLLIRSGAAKPRSKITSWSGWPADVVETLHRWNRKGRLSFRYHRQRFPRCEFCGLHFERESTVAVLYRVAERNGASKYGRTACDDCVIARARAVADD